MPSGTPKTTDPSEPPLERRQRMQKSTQRESAVRFHEKRITRLFLCALLILASAFLLASCSHSGGSSEILSKEELRENCGGTTKNYSYVCEYLDKWDFPTFDMKKFKEVENKFLGVSIYNRISARQHALFIADKFIESYYDTTDLSNPTAVTDSLLKAYTEVSGDRFAKYYSADEYADYLKKMNGEAAGIGITAKISDGNLTVVDVYEQQGAYDAGIIPGDIILSVDGLAATADNLHVLYEKLFGEEGSSVLISLERKKQNLGEGKSVSQIISVTAERERSVSYSLNTDKNDFNNDGIGFIKITTFNENTASLFREAIDYMTENGAKGIVFDLRDNRGGYLDSVIRMVEYLAPINKKIVTYQTKNEPRKVIRVKDAHTLSLPCVILCNENTASAGELFTAALRDYTDMNALDALVVGESTYGKGVLQDTFTLGDGSAITITSACYYPPSDVSYDEKGISPSVTVENSEQDALNSYDRQKDIAAYTVAERIAIYHNKLTKEEFLSNLQDKLKKPQNDYDYVIQYLAEWNFPLCDMNKIRAVEDTYAERVSSSGYNVFELAKKTALLFVDKYYETTDLTDRSAYTNAIISAWVSSLGDEWSAYLTEAEFANFEQKLSGKSVGIGITIDKVTHLIVNVFRDSDSFTQGIRENDLLYKVNGVEFKFDDPETTENEDNYSEIAKLFQGELNGTVELTLKRGETTFDVTVTRKLINTRTVTYSVNYYKLTSDGTKIFESTESDYDFKIGYIDISSFNLNTAEQFKEAIDELESRGVDAFIFDVRSNTGGALDSVVECISYLVRADETIVSFEYTNGSKRQQIKSSGAHSIDDIPCVVLCNKSTASAGELFAAALRDYTDMSIMNALIVGEQTYGKGVMQETQKLYDGSGVTFTVAKYYPPSGVDGGFHGTGVTPDITVSGASAQLSRGIVEIYKMLLERSTESAE